MNGGGGGRVGREGGEKQGEERRVAVEEGGMTTREGGREEERSRQDFNVRAASAQATSDWTAMHVICFRFVGGGGQDVLRGKRIGHIVSLDSS